MLFMDVFSQNHEFVEAMVLQQGHIVPTPLGVAAPESEVEDTAGDTVFRCLRGFTGEVKVNIGAVGEAGLRCANHIAGDVAADVGKVPGPRVQVVAQGAVTTSKIVHRESTLLPDDLGRLFEAQ